MDTVIANVEQKVETQAMLTITKKIGYLVHGSTGCSCCRSDNFICGIKDTHDEALESAIYYHDRKTVCSQYSTHGIYTIKEIEYEELSDGRVIVDNRVFDDRNFWESGSIAEDLRYVGTTKDTIE